MGVGLVGDWRLAQRFCGMGAQRASQALDKSLAAEAHLYRREVIKGMTSQAPAGQAYQPLSALTVAMRKYRRFRGRKALIDRGDLRRSIVVIKAPSGGYFVGVLRNAAGRGGRKLVNIAAVHEYGATVNITMTVKMRRFLMRAFRLARVTLPRRSQNSGQRTLVVRIPARPTFGPVFDAMRNDMVKRVVERVDKALAEAMK
jgi:hypothetical protein